MVIDPATGQPVPMAAYDEQSMHVDQTQLVGPSATGPNIIQNREDFEGVDAEPRSHDFQTHQVFGDITQQQTNRSVMASPLRQVKKLTAAQQRHRNQALGKLGTASNPFVNQGVENTRKLLRNQLQLN